MSSTNPKRLKPNGAESLDSFRRREQSPAGDYAQLSKDYKAGLPADLNDRQSAARPGIATGRVRWHALFSLVVIAAFLAEFLTGSNSIPQVIAYPPSLAFNVALYGTGALLIREASIRWRKRWAAVLLLGGAYAVGEEGFAAKTMINPNSPIIGNQFYSHWLGVNWVPLAALTVFHAAFSIMVPILLVELLFPDTRGRSLLGNVGLAITMMVYGLTVFVLTAYLGDPYVITPGVAIFLAAYAAGFILAAYRIPRSFLQAKAETPDRRERNFLLLGLGFMAGFFLIGTGLTPIGTFAGILLPWPVIDALFVPLTGLTAWYLVKHAGRSKNDLVKIAFVLGIMLVIVPMDVSLELSGDVGVLVFTALVIGLLIWLRQRVKRVDMSLPVS